MRLTMYESEKYRILAGHPAATAEESELLGNTAGLIAADLPIGQSVYLRCEALSGSALSDITPILDREG